MKHPFVDWCFGLALVIGLPIGLLVALSEGSLLAGFASTIAVVTIGLVVHRKEINQECKEVEDARQGK